MAAFKIDGDFTVASATAKPLFTAPIDGINTLYLLSQPFMQLKADYSPLALNAAHPDFGTFKLVQESALRPLGQGLVEWVRTYAVVPSQHNEFESYAYNFIGLNGYLIGILGADPLVTTSTPYGRERFTRIVTSRIQHDYFITGPSQTYTTPQAIPTIVGQKYYWLTPDVPTDYLSDSPPYTMASTPDRTTYLGWVSGGTEFVAEDSNLTRWNGLIFVRKTRYIIAQ
jgi:hypothetical protein